MSAFAQWPIRQKFVFLVMVTVLVTLTLTCLASIVFDTLDLRRSLAEDLSTTATLIGDSNTAALVFHDSKGAKESLQALRLRPQVVAGCIYSAQGELFAGYQRAASETCPESASEDGTHIVASRLVSTRSVLLQGEKVGSVCIVSDLSKLWQRLKKALLIVFGVLLFSSAVAFLLARKFERLLSKPLVQLANVASRSARRAWRDAALCFRSCFSGVCLLRQRLRSTPSLG